MLLQVECDMVEDGKGSETSMKSFVIKSSMSEIVSLKEGGEKTVSISSSQHGSHTSGKSG